MRQALYSLEQESKYGIQNFKKFNYKWKKTNEDILTIADVYYAAERLTDEQYTEIVNIVTKTFQ